MKLGCVIMAAGESRRFGRENKLLRELDGVPLCVRAMAAVPGELFAKVCVVTAYDTVAERAKAYGFTVVCNDRPEQGISRTIRLGIETMAECDGILFMTADQPLLTQRTLRMLVEEFSHSPHLIVAAARGGKRGNPCLFPCDLFESLLNLEGDAGGSRVIRANADRLCLVEVPAEELADCDTVRELELLEKSMK